MRRSMLANLALNEAERLREEDPYTARWLTLSDTRVGVELSRFEVDLNRPRHSCVYLLPSDAWGLQVWRTPLGAREIQSSRELYDAFYTELYELLAGLCSRFGAFVVYDLHSYNHRRQGPRGPASPPELAPEVNVGTGSLDRRRWGHVVTRFMTALRAQNFQGRSLDVRENVNFRGGQLSRWVNAHFSDHGCAIAIEVKKFFMDEWSGAPDDATIAALGAALAATVPPVLDAVFAPIPTSLSTSRLLQ